MHFQGAIHRYGQLLFDDVLGTLDVSRSSGQLVLKVGQEVSLGGYQLLVGPQIYDVLIHSATGDPLKPRLLSFTITKVADAKPVRDAAQKLQ